MTEMWRGGKTGRGHGARGSRRPREAWAGLGLSTDWAGALASCSPFQCWGAITNHMCLKVAFVLEQAQGPDGTIIANECMDGASSLLVAGPPPLAQVQPA